MSRSTALLAYSLVPEARGLGAMAWMRDLPARLALRCTNIGVIDRLLDRRHAKALAMYKGSMPILTGIDLKIVEGLRRDGIFMTSLAKLGLPGSAEMLASARMVGDAFSSEARRLSAEGTAFTIVPPDIIASRPEIFAWGLHERLLDIVEAYLGVPAGYDGVNLIYTAAGGKEAGPRCWHRDWEDRRTIKIGIYCNDVVAGGGPFQLIRRRDSTQGGGHGYRYVLADDTILTEKLGADYDQDIVSCEGPAGTVFFCETALHFHRGEPAVHADRQALFHSYFARVPRHPFLCERSGLNRSQISHLARTLNHRQRASAYWRRDLPWLIRLIPRARI